MSKKTKLTRVLILTFALVLCLGMLFTSCGEDEETPKDDTSTTTTPTTKPGTTSTTGAGTTDSSNQGITDPSSGTTDPSSGTTDPSSGTTDPSSGTTDPSSGTTDPSSGTTDPSSGTTDPSSGTTDSSNQDPTDDPCTEHTGGTATCTKKAVCENCGAEYGELAAHTGGQATCEEKAVCNNCDQEYGELGEHSWTEATCESPKTCSICETTEGEALGHVEKTPATCKDLATCSVCNSSYGVLADCQYNKTAEAVENVDYKIVLPTCSEEGKKIYICKVCGKDATNPDYIETIEKLPHTEVDIAPVEPTCTEAGSKDGKKCSVCDTVTVEPTAVPANGHTEVDIAPVEPTCTEAGSKDGKKCSVCDTVTVEPTVVAEKGHDLKETVVDPTCEGEGYTEITCNNGCGYNDRKDVVPANGHKEKTAATCSSKAVCEICGEEYGETAPHSYTVKGQTFAPTCVEDGYTEYGCTGACGTTEKKDIVTKLDHVYDVKGETIAPTCITKGYTEYGCSVSACGTTQQKDFVDEIDHVYNVTVETVDPTCCTKGYTVFGCSAGACETTENGDYVDEIDHVYDVKGETVDPTCYAEGYTVFSCSAGECGKTENREYTRRTAHTFDYIENLAEFDIIYCTTCNQAYINKDTGVTTNEEKLCLGCDAECTCEALNNVECTCEPKVVCECEALNNKECTCDLTAPVCTCGAENAEDCTCDLTAPECTCEAAENVECTCEPKVVCECDARNNVECTCCTCGVIVEWHGYTKPGDPETVVAGEAVGKDGEFVADLALGLIKLTSAEECTFTVVVNGDEYTFTGTEFVVDFYDYEAIESIVYSGTTDVTVVFYKVFAE